MWLSGTNMAFASVIMRVVIYLFVLWNQTVRFGVKYANIARDGEVVIMWNQILCLFELVFERLLCKFIHQ